MLKKNKLTRSSIQFLLTFFVSLLLIGCSSGIGESIRVSKNDLAKYGSIDTADVIASFKKKISDARDSNMIFLAPNYFKEASNALESAEDYLQKKKSRGAILELIVKGEKLLNEGALVMTDVHGRLKESLELKKSLENLGADKYFKKDYRDIVEQISNLIADIERGETGDVAKTQARLVTIMQSLQLSAIKYNALHKAEEIIKKAEEIGGEKEAPLTFGEAKVVYQKSVNGIEQNRFKEDVIKTMSENATFAAYRALNVTKRVAVVKNLFDESPEKLVLEEESNIHKISKALGHEDVRDKALDVQIGLISRAISVLSMSGDDLRETEKRLGETEKRLGETEKRLKETEKKLGESLKKIDSFEKEVQLLTEKIAEYEESSRESSNEKAEDAERFEKEQVESDSEKEKNNTEGESTEGESTEGESTEGESTEGESTEGESTEK